jgi:hypothetical protein
MASSGAENAFRMKGGRKVALTQINGGERLLFGRNLPAVVIWLAEPSALSQEEDYQDTPDTVIGFEISPGGTSWNLSEDFGGGKSADMHGVPKSILYDNTRIAVACILGDGARQRTQVFSELKSHYLFGDRFGRPGKGNDKGKVEGLVGYARRNFLAHSALGQNSPCDGLPSGRKASKRTEGTRWAQGRLEKFRIWL